MTKPNVIRVLSPTGVLGAGFKSSSLDRGVRMQPHVIACDAGSTDPGPYYLGSDKPKMSHTAIKRDLSLLLKARDELGVPLIIGSCGTSGRDSGVAWFREIAIEIAKESGLSFNLAAIFSDQSSECIAKFYRDGKLIPLSPAPKINEEIIQRSNIVAMMGVEPIQNAIKDGADVILAGRASDSALFAAVPIMLGADEGLSWHAAKNLECGAASAVVPAADGLFARIGEGFFEIETLDPKGRCTPQTVAAHTLYENSSPFFLYEPSGVAITTDAKYEAVNDRVVRVTGSQFSKAEQYTVKLEGSECVGYQTVAFGGIRDPYIIRSIDALLDEANEHFDARIADLFSGSVLKSDYRIQYRIYGRDGVMGDLEPERNSVTPHEVGILITVTARTQDLAAKICNFVCHVCAHLPVPEYHGLISSIAYPFSPPEVDRGPTYRFSMNHVIAVDDPLELFRIDHEVVQ